MASEIEINEACSLLETDILRHIVALKMIQLFGRGIGLDLSRSDSGWALVVRMPDGLSPWDRSNYGSTLVAIVDGSGPEPQLQALDSIPERPVVVKTSEGAVAAELMKRGAEPKASFLSLTSVRGTPRPETPNVVRSEILNEDAARLFCRNGYSPDALFQFFAEGASLFGVREAGRLASACFVYQNYEKVWEIASVWTEPEFRGRGLARRVVLAALTFLDGEGRTPRYHVRADNAASLAVARACGLVEFLKFDHYLLERPA